MRKKEQGNRISGGAARLIVRGRFLILAVFVLLSVFCVYGLTLTRTNGDITSYLSADTETARGLKVMNAEFPPLRSGGSEAENYNGQLIQEMAGVLAISGAVILLVLLLTTASFADVIVCFIVFAVSALLNMGTHFLLGTVSSITNTVSVILQLALSIDYAIIFAGHCTECEAEEADEKSAVSLALKATIREIISSSLTTVCGLMALTLMHFRFGADLGVALAKGVVVSMLTVFFLMPALMVFFAPLRRRMRHRMLVPRVRFLGRMAAGKPVLCFLFLLLFLPAAFLSFRAVYAFNGSAVTPVIPVREESVPEAKPAMMAILVPSGDEQGERNVIAEVKKLPAVQSVTGYVNMPESLGVSVSPYDRFTPSEAAELTGLDPQLVSAAFRLYALEKGNLAAQLNIGRYSVSLEDAADFIFSDLDRPVIQQYVPEEYASGLQELKNVWQEAKTQLKGSSYMRLVVTADTVPGSDEAETLLNSIHAILGNLYPGQDTYVCGEVTSAHDLRSSFGTDSTRVNVLSALFVFLILTFTGFKDTRRKMPGPGSVLTALILVFVIQGSIFINFSLTNLLSQHPLFVTQMIGTAIQMGATVDYAIVLSGRYREERKFLSAREAAAAAVEKSFVTVMTSGSIMTCAGLMVAYRVSDVYVGHIGLIVGRGALISSLLVLLVLPQLLRLCDRGDKKKEPVMNA